MSQTHLSIEYSVANHMTQTFDLDLERMVTVLTKNDFWQFTLLQL